MVTRMNFKQNAITYIQTCLVYAGPVWMPLSIMLARSSEAFGFLSPLFDARGEIDPGGEICFCADLLDPTGDDNRDMEIQNSDFIYSLLKDRPGAGLAVYSPYQGSWLRTVDGWRIANVPCDKIGLAPQNPDTRGFLWAQPLQLTAQNTQELLSWIRNPRTVCAVVDNIGLVGAALTETDPAPAIGQAIADGCRGILMSAFGDYGWICCIPPDTLARPQLPGSTGVRHIDLGSRARDYMFQRLCDSNWWNWIENTGAAWMLAPDGLQDWDGGLMAAKLADLPIRIDPIAAEDARRSIWTEIVDFVKREPGNAALFSRVPKQSWPHEIQTYAMDRGVKKATGSQWNVLTRESASLEAVASLWRGRTPVCALIKGYDGTTEYRIDWLKQRFVSADSDFTVINNNPVNEVQQKLVPSMEQLIVGVYAGDLCSVWPKKQ